MTFYRILHPTDFSAASSPALAVACSLAAEIGAEVIVLHVSQLTAVVRSSGVSLVTADNTDELKAQLHRIVSPVAGVRLSHRLEHGEPDVMIPTRGRDEWSRSDRHGDARPDRAARPAVARERRRESRPRRPVMTVPANWVPPNGAVGEINEAD